MPQIKKSKRFRIYLRDGFECSYCNRSVLRNEIDESELTLDHIKPKAKGGNNGYSNLTTSCIRCNHKKGNKSLKQFRKTILKNGFNCIL